MTEISPEKTSTPRTHGGPGHLIRQAREAAKLSIEDLAGVIKLSRLTVDALERDDFATLKEPVYVRGYYRKLSKVLHLNEGELIASYDSVALPVRAVVAPSKAILSNDREVEGRSSGNLGLYAVCALVAIALGAGAFFLLRSQTPENTDAAVLAPAAESSTTATATVEAIVPPPAPVAAVAPAAEPAAAVPADPNAPLAGATAKDPAATPPATDPTTLPSATTPAASTGAAAAAPAPGSASLDLAYTKDCWTRVEDADGKTILSRIVASGETLALSGKAPFAISLGHAPGVQMKFNGTSVDMSGFTRSNGTARFSLP